MTGRESAEAVPGRGLLKTGAQNVFQALITGSSAGFATEILLYPIEGGLKPHVASLNLDLLHHPRQGEKKFLFNSSTEMI